METDKIKQFANEIESGLGLPTGFLFLLRDDGDWSFVIKAGTLIEAAVDELLRSAIEDTRLHRTFLTRRLRGSDGKLAVLKDIAAISAEDVRLAEALYKLRNQVAHDVRQVTFTLPGYLRSLRADEARTFWSAIVPRARADFLINDPSHSKLFVWLSLLNFLATAKLATARQYGERELRIRQDGVHEAAWRLFNTIEEASQGESDTSAS